MPAQRWQVASASPEPGTPLCLGYNSVCSKSRAVLGYRQLTWKTCQFIGPRSHEAICNSLYMSTLCQQVAVWNLFTWSLPQNIQIITTCVQRFLSPCTPPCRLPQKDLSQKQPSRQQIPHPSQHEIQEIRWNKKWDAAGRKKYETTRNVSDLGWLVQGRMQSKPHGFRLGLFQCGVHMIWELLPSESCRFVPRQGIQLPIFMGRKLF